MAELTASIAPAAPTSSQLGAALIERGYLTADRLNEALAEHQRTGRLLGRVLVESNYVTEEQIARTIAAQQGIPFVDLRRYDVVPDTVRILTELQARRFHAIVLEARGDSYLVGLDDPSNLRAQDELASVLGLPIDIAVITNDQFNQTVDRIYRKTEQIGAFAKEVERDLERDSGVVDLNQMTASIDDIDAPVVRLLQTIFDEAVQMRASDIHFEPQEKKLVVRFRIDGELLTQVEADPKISAALMVRLKLMAGLDISEKRNPQDGRITVKIGNNHLDIRMSSMPTQYGESVVLRVLVQTQALRNLEQLGMPPEMLKRFRRAIHAPNGIVLVTGPTGSGKTTTLYAALQILNQPNVKVMTCEDPVEYRISGINQVQVNEKHALTFARILRSFMRQDPDILLVGEIRDEETSEIAARAALTGHMVLSTLHTNDAVSTPARLLDLGVPGYMLASTLLAVLSQRLLRVICTHCSEPYQPKQDEIEWARHFLGDDVARVEFRHGKGCPRCNGIGYSGRVGVYEFLEITPELAKLLHNKDPIQFERMARAQLGNDTLENHALELAIKGKTSVSEVMKLVTSFEF